MRAPSIETRLLRSGLGRGIDDMIRRRYPVESFGVWLWQRWNYLHGALLFVAAVALWPYSASVPVIAVVAVLAVDLQLFVFADRAHKRRRRRIALLRGIISRWLP